MQSKNVEIVFSWEMSNYYTKKSVVFYLVFHVVYG